MLKIIRRKKAYYYSVDALIAVAVIFAILLVIKPTTKQKTAEIELQNDALEMLSTLKIGETDNYYVKQLISDNNASQNNTLLEQIAELYVKEDTRDKARELSENILSSLSTQENMGIWFGNDLVASYNTTPIEEAEQIWAARQLVSGVAKGENVKGYSARAFLSRTSQVDYYYFGGYIGDGNISIKVNYTGTIISALMEIAINRNFSLYINNNLQGYYEKTTSLYEPQTYSLPLSNFHSGENLIELRGNNLYIAGGYIKINYEDSFYSVKTKKYFPGISGLINIYDSFYIPSKLENMEVSLHYDSPYRLFLNIGNKTVYEGNGTKTVTLTNSQLSALLNYQDLSNKTIPVRLGLYELGGIIRRGNADVVLITDLSGSMDYRMDSDYDGTTRNCNDSNLYSNSTKRVSLAKCLDKMVVDMILNVSGNRLALSAFYGEYKSGNNKGIVARTNLTSNKTYLNANIDSYWSRGGTCICCAINSAYKILSEQGNASRQKFVIVMSDGIPTHSCGQQITDCQGLRTGYPSNDEAMWWGENGCYGGSDDCNVTDCECASQNANWSSCRLKTINTTVYSIGFGPVSSCNMANKTLQSIASCGGGVYRSSQNPDALKGIYEEIANEIISVAFVEQVSNATGNLSLTRLYPDSYISFNYSYQLPYGLSVTSETQKFGNEISEGNFSIPADSTPVEAIAVSYSASKWTDKVQIYNEGSWKDIFKLSDYGSNYLSLGDPYFIYIPKEKIKGENKVKITTATSPLNSSGGSASDKVIYTILKNVSGYSPIKITADGCIWVIEFYDSTNITIKVPSNYSGDSICYYTSENRNYNENDAINYAVFDLLNRSLDFNSDGRLDSKFSSQDLHITETEISGIPSAYTSEMQVRVWR